MCGYVGFINKLETEKSAQVLDSMMNEIIHRGPDADGKYLDDSVCLGFRRLSIIDLESGDQPIYNEDNTKILLFNGEIYNYKQLREELISAGHTFSTETDSEVILHGFEEYGTEVVKKLRGMFSFIIWNKAEKSIFGARDMFGIKPLYYCFTDNELVFGSEIKSFFHHPNVKKKLNEAALEQYLSFQYSPYEETFFKGIFRLPPAHFFTYENGEFKKERYFKPDFKEDSSHSFEEYADIIDETIRESVEAHKISDVEVGSFLSSGIDSSYIASAANVDKTFTVGFDGEKYNEISYAEEFSKFINVKNINRVITKEEYFESLNKVQYHTDEPLADPSAVALYFVCKLASEHVKVVLSGEGADELFGGYNIYGESFSVPAYYKIPFFIRRFISFIASKFPHVRGFNFLIRRGQRLEERFIGNAYIFTKKERDRLLKNPAKEPDASVLCKPYYDEVKSADEITKMQYIDIHMWLAGDILLKADRMSMAHSLEVRVPFLDKKVMAVAERLPMKYRVSANGTKLALRAAAAKTLPDKTASKKKLGFPVPIRVWLKQDDIYNMVKSEFESETAKKYFKTGEIIKLLDVHRTGKRDNSRKIWTVFSFLVWHKVYFEEV